MKLLDLYKSILKTANLVVTEDGCVSRSFGGKSDPAMVKGKRLVLPTKDHLSNPDWKERVAFHPLSENVLRGESAVLEEFRSSLNVRINYTIGLLAYQLLTIAASPDEHKKLSPDQTEFLSKVKNADEGALDLLKKLMKAMKTDMSNRAFVHIFLKRSGSVDGKKYSRVGVVTFPLYEELKKPVSDDGIWGVKGARKKHIEALKHLLEYMIPGIETPHSHDRGSNSEMAPYLDALMKAVLSVAAPMNDMIELFRNQLDTGDENDPAGPDALMFEDKWVETFENLEVMRNEMRSVPMQSGNDGTPSQTTAAAPVGSNIPTTPAAAPASPLPAALMGPVGGYPAPQQPSAFQAAAAAPGPVRTANGVDFDSLLRNNAALAQQVGGVGGFAGGGGFPQQQQNNTPRWAQGGSAWGQAAPQQQQGWGNTGGGWNQSAGYNPSI